MNLRTVIDIKKIIFLLFICLHFSSFAQTTITISGRAIDKDNNNLPLPNLMIINKRTNTGSFADAEGKFSIVVQKNDSILFSAVGFLIKKICLKDSVLKDKYYVVIEMHKLQYTLKEISVFATRDLNELQKEINSLGVKHDYSIEGIGAIESPITYLYERYSWRGKSKQKVAELENEDMKRDILKDLFRLYIKNDIIDLSDAEFDAFIKYLNFTDEFMQSATQFELTMAIKGKYESFKYRWK